MPGRRGVCRDTPLGHAGPTRTSGLPDPTRAPGRLFASSVYPVSIASRHGSLLRRRHKRNYGLGASENIWRSLKGAPTVGGAGVGQLV